MEHKIIAALAADRSSFDRIDPHLSTSDLSPEGGQVLKAIRRFYYKDLDAKQVDLDLIKSAVVRKLTNAKHSDLFAVYFQNVAHLDVSAVNVVEEVLSAKREVVSMHLADAILSKQEEQITKLLSEFEALRADSSLEGAVHEEYQGVSADTLLLGFDPEHLIKIAPRSLNRRLGGGVLRGTHIVVVARPELGKTLIVITMLAGFVSSNLKVLYVGNEDPIKAVVMRALTNITNMTADEIKNDPLLAMEKARNRGYDNAIFAGLNGGTIGDVRALCTKYHPDVLIVDQIRNLTTDAENRTTQLETIARSMRNLAREFDCVAVSVTQAGDSARDKLILDLGDVDGSNTGIPGACDIMLMAGFNQSYDDQNIRMFKLAKNKASGVHDNWTVGIDKKHSRITEI